MTVQPNIVLGVVGIALALLTGSFVAANWRDLTGLDKYEATFEIRHVLLPQRSASIGDDANGAGAASERHELRQSNISLMSIDLTWQESALGAHNATLKVFDPHDKMRATATHQGGASGIHVDIQILDPKLVPDDGRVPFEARGGSAARTTFETRWPSHPETAGNWTFQITTASQSGFPGGSVFYNLHVEYDYFAGAYEKVPALVK